MMADKCCYPLFEIRYFRREKIGKICKKCVWIFWGVFRRFLFLYYFLVIHYILYLWGRVIFPHLSLFFFVIYLLAIFCNRYSSMFHVGWYGRLFFTIISISKLTNRKWMERRWMFFTLMKFIDFLPNKQEINNRRGFMNRIGMMELFEIVFIIIALAIVSRSWVIYGDCCREKNIYASWIWFV